MVKAIVAPAHANALEALLNQPFTSTFDVKVHSPPADNLA
jgi:hypothetical protein